MVVTSDSTESSNSAILAVYPSKSCVRLVLDLLRLFISSCCLFCVSRSAVRVVEWFARVEWLVRVEEWLLIVSACWTVHNLTTLTSSRSEARVASNLSS